MRIARPRTAPARTLLALSLPALLVACGDKDEGGEDYSNEAPTAPEISIGPADPSDDDDLVVSIVTESTDPDGDSITYKYKWFLDGEPRADLVSDTIPAGATRKGQVWRVEVRAFDGIDKSGTATAEATILNALPQVAVSISPTEVGTDGSLKALVTANDPDGEEVETWLTWYVDGEAVAETSDVLEGDEYFDKGQEIWAEALAIDPDGGEATATSETVVVGNTAPTAPGVDIIPESPLIDESFVCLITGGETDRDGETITYDISWTKNGAAFTDTTTTTWDGDTVGPEHTAEGDIFECSVTATDGEATTAARTATATIIAWEGPREFDNCGQTGETGPSQSQCDDQYAGTLLDGFVTVEDGYQLWEVPSNGDYRITACGAQGAGAATSNDGGLGNCVASTHTLVKGDLLTIVVGQIGTGEDSGSNGGGGGGTFVVAEGDVPLVIGGGGAGTRTSASMDGCNGRDDEYGGANGGYSSSSSCDASSTEPGEGGSVTYTSYGAAGGGFNSDGDDDYGGGGASWFNGLTGGEGYSCGTSAPGGFGGGGSGNGCYGGGGGGGYTGGDGGYVAGAGGSYAGGTDADWNVEYNEGAGSVTIDLAE